MNPALASFPPENLSQILTLVTWALLAFGAVWLVTSVIGARHRRAYNLTHAESGGSKKIQPDFLNVDKAARAAAIARGQQYDAQLTKRETPPSAVAQVSLWSRIAAGATAIIGLLFTAIGTMQRVQGTDEAIKDLGSWEKFRILITQHQLGAILCVAVIATYAYVVVKKLRKPGGE